MIPLSFGCSPPVADRYLSWRRDGDDYTIEARPIGALHDLSTLDGALGRGWAGGRLRLDGERFVYQGGQSLDIGYSVDGGLAVPLDRDGLILWSFYGHLEDFTDELPSHGIDASALLPLTIAHTPSLPDLLLELLPMENAAYATGGHTFLLFEDLIDKAVPFAANPGVVRHEFGHAVFHAATAGDIDAPAPFSLGDTDDAASYYASLHEGYADLLAALTLDTPDLFAGSLEVEARRLDVAHAPDEVTLPEEVDPTEDPLSIYDPYPLGTLIASIAWDLRIATGDPGEALAVALGGLEIWAAAESFGDIEGLLDAWIEAAPEHEAVLCASIDARLEGIYTEGRCL